MENSKMKSFLNEVLQNMPQDWLRLTTHRLDIYIEKLAKTQFIEQFENLYQNNDSDHSALESLPTAYDYIRLGHPLSSVLEWGVGKMHGLDSENVISFASITTPILAVLRKNSLENRDTRLYYTESLPESFDEEVLRDVYGYAFEMNKVSSVNDIPKFDDNLDSTSTILISQDYDFNVIDLNPNVDFYVLQQSQLGSLILVNGSKNKSFVSEIQHVRRRESIAMTPADCVTALNLLIGNSIDNPLSGDSGNNKSNVLGLIKNITGTRGTGVIGSSGLSIQYAIVMGLIHDAIEKHKGKTIRIIVPPNCYGGTNDQARRVAACLPQVDVVDLPVDDGHDMAHSVDKVLDQMAKEDAIPYIIAEIPTNPRVEVPDLKELRKALEKERFTPSGDIAVEPVFILDQTFCPNVHFLGRGEILSTIKTIAYVSGSKFPSGGLCTAGYCVANEKADYLMQKIDLHLRLADNEATGLQVEILAQQMPSMIQRVKDAYSNTRAFVNYIEETLPSAKINFVSQTLAEQGFTPSVFSLDLPTKGDTEEERENYKRALNLRLIIKMISEIPNESKFCVSYGQLKGCYWTIPATSTQGTTKEGDKDYIVRVSVSPDLDLKKHLDVFKNFVNDI